MGKLPAPLSAEVLKETVTRVLETEGWDGSVVSVVFVDDTEIARIHAEFLDDPEPTDVITFDLRERELGGDHEHVGAELIISRTTAERVAAEKGHAPYLELLLYVVHGLLHLAGEEDRTDEERQRMRERERAWFEALEHPYPD